MLSTVRVWAVGFRSGCHCLSHDVGFGVQAAAFSDGISLL